MAQDSFLRAFRYLPKLEQREILDLAVQDRILDLPEPLRKQNPDIRSLDDEDRPVKLKDEEGDPDAAYPLEKGERSATIQRAIPLLSPDDAGIITLFYLYEQSLEEITQIMELTMTNAKTKLSRARQRLKSIMEEKFAAELKEIYNQNRNE